MKNRLKQSVLDASSNEIGSKMITLIRKNPNLAARISKLVTPKEKTNYNSDGSKNLSHPDTFHMKTMSQDIALRVKDAETILQLLPDLELAAQILISSILSPKDMTNTEINFQPPEGIFSSETSMALITRIRNYFETDYKLKPLCPVILRETLFRTGSLPICVIPENSLDDLINRPGRVSMESITPFLDRDGNFSSLGLIGDGGEANVKKTASGIAIESLTSPLSRNRGPVAKVIIESKELHISVTDNPNLLKVPRINERIRHQAVMERVGIRSMEAFNQITDRDFTAAVYKSRDLAYKPMVSVRPDEQLKRSSIGEPLILQLPSESVIPVYSPGTPEKHIGFFVLIDANGFPISAKTNEDFYRQVGANLSNGMRDFPSAMVNKVNNQMNTGESFTWKNPLHQQYAIRAYGEMIENDLIQRLKNGIYGDGVAIAKNDEVYRMMMARTLSKQNTQLLFIPIELMTYFAFKYDDNGVGKSIIEDMKILLSQRIMLMFSNTMAAMRNSIGRTEVKLKLDEDDPDPKATIEKMINELVRTRQQGFPLGANSPVDIVEYLQRASMEFTFEGHPGLPDVQIDFGEKNSSYTKPDTDLEDNLRKRSIMAFGLSPETVDNGFASEFATTVVSNNILLSKRIIQLQEIFCPQLSDHARKVIIGSQSLMDDLTSIVKENLDSIKTDRYPGIEKDKIVSKVIYDFIANFTVSLPSPNSITMENQAAALDSFAKLLDPALDAWISDRFFVTDLAGNTANEVGAVRELVKAYFIRQWMSENGVLPEISVLTATDEDGKPAVDFFKENAAHVEALTKSLTQLMVKLQPMIKASNTELENRVGDMQGGQGGGSSGDDSSGGGGGGGVDDFDIGGFDEPETDENPENPNPEEANPDGGDENPENTKKTDAEPAADDNNPAPTE